MRIPKKIVLTGGPGTGKTALINALEQSGHHCYHEVIRSMTASAKQLEAEKAQVSNPLVFVDDPLKFNTFLLNERVGQFKIAEKSGVPITFFDRGTCDVLAYMDYFGQVYDDDFVNRCSEYRYDIIFVTPPWKEIYVRDNERLETFEEAESIHGQIMKSYRRFGYEPIEIPKGTIPDRVAFITHKLKLNV